MAVDNEHVMIRCSISGDDCIGFQLCSTCCIANAEEIRVKDDWNTYLQGQERVV